MRKPGPIPLPSAMKRRFGVRPSRIAAVEPRPRPGAPTCPRWLPREAKAEWRRIVPELARLGLLSIVDRAALVVYVQAWSDLVSSRAVLAREGSVFKTKTGYLGPRPEVAIANKAARTIMQSCALFGLSPSDRGRMSVKEPDNFDDESDLVQPIGRLGS